MQKLCLFVLMCFLVKPAFSQQVVIDSSLGSKFLSRELSFLEDPHGILSITDVLQGKKFTPVEKDILNLNITKSTFWIKFTIRNRNSTTHNFIEVVQPLLMRADFFEPDGRDNYVETRAGQNFPFYNRKEPLSANFAYPLQLKPGEIKTYFLRISSNKQMLIPIQIITEPALSESISSGNLWFGIYCGIIIVMVLYNLFIFFSIRDKSSLYYVLHTLFVGLTQATLIGYTYKYFWPRNVWFGNYSTFLFTCLVSIVGVQFLIEFMRLKEQERRLFYILKFFQALYVVYLILSSLGYYTETYSAILLTQAVIAIFILCASIYLLKKGYAEAKFYLIGWSSLMAGIVIYVLKDYGALNYNEFTAHSLMYGSAAEVTLLSFALADKINIYKLEKEKSQEKELLAVLENERMAKEQNVMLERKVNERTLELRIVNDDLVKVLKDLKDAEGQLVESEKMAALGQLTAGIAHEINNPINFVTSNVAPLKRDVDMILEMLDNIESVALSESSIYEKTKEIEDYKEEMDFDYLKTEISHLIRGINEGAFRTAEIVKGLRIFSRVDENDLKHADINEGLDSTIVLINNLLVNKIQLIKEYDKIPMIECYPGKLNQVFLNIISNAIHAINKKHTDKMTGVLKVMTTFDDENIHIHIIDNGTGMDETTKKKIFEPFFTTKEVGEGTGLGMSIAYTIIKKHNGIIHVNSTPGQGTEFVLDLPINHISLIDL